jgi:hypothetical protein
MAPLPAREKAPFERTGGVQYRVGPDGIDGSFGFILLVISYSWWNLLLDRRSCTRQHTHPVDGRKRLDAGWLKSRFWRRDRHCPTLRGARSRLISFQLNAEVELLMYDTARITWMKGHLPGDGLTRGASQRTLARPSAFSFSTTFLQALFRTERSGLLACHLSCDGN